MEQVLYSAGNIKAARVKAGYTQEQAAKQLGVSVQVIRFYEQSRSEPSLKRLRDIGRLYGVSIIV